MVAKHSFAFSDFLPVGDLNIGKSWTTPALTYSGQGVAIVCLPAFPFTVPWLWYLSFVYA